MRTPVDRLLLAVDFPGRRSEARVADLELEQAGWEVRYLLEEELNREPDAARYAARLLGDAPVAGAGAVLAYCMAAPVAHEVARLAGAPLLVLFDGEPVAAQTLAVEYRSILRGLGSSTAALPDWWDDTLAARRDPSLVDAIEADLTGHARAAFDGEDELAEPLVRTYVDWLAFLAAAGRADFPPWPGAVHHVASSGHRPAGPWPGAAATTVTFVDSDRAGLLADPGTRKIVIDLLEAAR